MSQYDVLVIGAGVVGLAASLAMSFKGYKVALVDAGPIEQTPALKSSRVYAINRASQTLLQTLHAWAFLETESLSPYQSMHVWDAANGHFIDFDARQLGASSLGTIIEENSLKVALLQAIAAQESIHLFPNYKIDGIQNNKNFILIKSQTRDWEGRLLMVADGANSPIRSQLGVELTSWPYRQQSITANVLTEKSHQATAFQVFNPDGPLAFLPLRHTHHCSIVWSTTLAEQRMELDEQSFNETLSKAFGERLGHVQLISRRQSFPLHMRHVKQYVGPRWLLLGDAAHTIHPLAGLGLNIGLADVCSWMNIEGMKAPLFSNKQLAAYQRERKYSVWQTIVLMEGFKRLFSHSFGGTVLLRGLGLKFCNELPALKRLFIQYASGA